MCEESGSGPAAPMVTFPQPTPKVRVNSQAGPSPTRGSGAGWGSTARCTKSASMQ